MTAGSVPSVLQKMAATGRETYQSRAVTLAKALRLSSAKVADDLYDMALSMIGYSEEARSGDDVEAVFDDGDLLILLDGPNRLRGAAALDRSLVGALIQQQTMGKVLPAPEPEERTMTATDAALVAPFVDELLARAQLLPEDGQDRQLLDGFRFGSHSVDARLVALALDAHEFQQIRLTFDIAKGVRQGNLVLLLPLQGALEDTPILNENGNEAVSPPPVNMHNTVMELEADLTVALTRLSMPFSELRELAPGGVIDLGIDRLDAAMLTTLDGKIVARGQVGQAKGQRALQLSTSAELSAHVDEPLDTMGLDDTEPEGTVIDAAVLPAAEEASVPLPETALPDLPDLDDLPDLPSLDDLPPLDLKVG